MKRFFISIILLFGMLFAASNPKAMIVFDASGSMWGQIDGKAKYDGTKVTILEFDIP